MDSVQKKIIGLCLENQIGKFSHFADAYSSTLKRLSQDFVHTNEQSAFVRTEIGNYGEVCQFDLLSGTTGPSKSILVFLHWIEESDLLLADLKLTQDLFLQVDKDLNEQDNSSEPLDNQISSLSDRFEFLCGASRMVMRLIECSRCLVEQCVGGISVHKGDVPVALSVVIESLCRIMRQIETIDEIINSSRMKYLWLVFKGKVFNHYQLIESEIAGNAKGVGAFIEELDVFFAGNYFVIFLTEVNSTKGAAQKDSLALLSNAILLETKALIREAQKYKADLSDYVETNTLITISLLVVFSYNYFGNINASSSVFKQLLILTGRHCCLSIVPTMLWRPEHFLERHAAELIGKQLTSYSKSLQNQRRVYLQTKLSTLQSFTHLLAFQVITGIFSMAIAFGRQLKTPEDLQGAVAVALRLLSMAGTLRCTVTSLINLHIAFELELPQVALIGIGKLVELLISLRWTFEAHAKSIQFNMQTAQELGRFKVLTAIDTLLKKKKSGRHREDILNMLEKCVNGALTKKRMLVFRLAATESVQKMLAQEIGDVNELIKTLLFCMAPTFDEVMDTTFLVGNPAVLRIYLRKYFVQNEDPARLSNFVSALSHSVEQQQRPEEIESLAMLLRDALKTELVHKLSREIENRLRLEFHKKLNKNSAEMLNSLSIRDLRPILNLRPLQSFHGYYDIRAGVEAELSHTFYNLITVSPHDGRTYGDMQEIAACKYGLQTIPDGLPVKTVDQACDIMDILRDLPAFVQTFCYDLNSQVFVEKLSQNKHLNAILVADVCQSIKTHGIGIINTTVNVTYQFLKNKFHVLSKILFDEHIKSRLIRDQRIVSDRIMNKTVPVYPIEAGANLIKQLRTTSTVPYMDRFRELLVEMGNALGFVRSMRSGRLEMGANAIEHFNWSNLDGEETRYHQEMSTCAEVNSLSAAITSLEHNFTESADYLKILVGAFQKSLQGDKFAHLRKFYLIIPALTMNYVEYIITLKEDLAGRAAQSHQYTDDGFIIGLVFILCALEQIAAFNSLSWFATVDKFYTDQIEKLQTVTPEAAAGFDQEKIMQTRSLSEKRFRALQREFNLLYYNMSSSKTYFK